MRFLVPAASAAAIVAMALSATATVPSTRSRPAPVSTTVVGSSRDGSSQAGATGHARSQAGSAYVGAVTHSGNALTAAHPRGTASSAPLPTGVAPRASYGWPLSPRPAVLRRFELPGSRWSAGHRGVDLSAAVGQPVLSAGDGIVAFSGVIAGRGVVSVQHSGGLRTTYEPVDERLASGTLVHRGAKIGVLSPRPGHCIPRRCLHWGAISGQTYRDPLSLLSFGRPILLPLG
jgi:murein DD-endopeptidase MepM/ murein hydrolase activator NlpD